VVGPYYGYSHGPGKSSRPTLLTGELAYQQGAVQEVQPSAGITLLILGQAVHEKFSVTATFWEETLMGTTPARRRVIALSLTALVCVAGCGSSSGNPTNGESSKTGPQVAKDAASALSAVGAIHMAGTLGVDGKPNKIDVQLQSDGGSGSISLAGAQVDFVSVGSILYVKASAAFYVSTSIKPAIAAKLANRWVELPPDTDFKPLTLAGLAKSLNEPDVGAKVEDKVTTGTLQGQAVVIIRSSDGSKLYVAATGKPYPLKIVNDAKSKDAAGTVTISGFGEHKTIKAPAGALDALKVIATTGTNA
jgi:hypothetical protein